MTKFEKIETTAYAVLWAFALYLVFQDVISPREVEVKPEPARAEKLSINQVMKGERRGANR